MNRFDTVFFKKYIPEGHELKDVVHIHPIVIFKSLFLYIGLFLVIPSFLFYKSMSIQNLIPFYYLEIYLILVYIKIVYEIFNRYNDVWIITSQGVISLRRALIKTNSATLGYENIEGISVDINSPIDKILKKGDLVIHKIGDEAFILENAMNPYKAVDLVESLGEDEEDEDINDSKFNKLLESLSGTIGNYENNGKKELAKNIEEEKKKYLKNAEKIQGTIDLREK